MADTRTPTKAHPITRRVLDAFEREFWAEHHDRSRLLAAALEVLDDAIARGADAADLLQAVIGDLRRCV
jgi:hypothetical protein